MAIQDGFSPSYWIKEKITIPASSSVLSASIPLSSFKSAKFLISAWIGNKTKYEEMAVKNENNNLTSTVGFKINGQFNLSVNEEVNGANMNIRLSTTETANVSLEMAYILLGQ